MNQAHGEAGEGSHRWSGRYVTRGICPTVLFLAVSILYPFLLHRTYYVVRNKLLLLLLGCRRLLL